MRLSVGSRWRSAVDETQVVVIRAPQEDLELTCGGHPLLPLDSEPGLSLVMAGGRDGGTVLGKRYADTSASLELLCTKGGTGALFLGNAALSVKAAKPLPSSD